jgi:diguanylate cyclase (GGDEF)-like protein
MKKNKQVFLDTALIIAMVLIVTFQFFIQRIEQRFTTYYSKQLDNYGSIISKTVEMAASYTDTYEQLLTDDLYYKLSALNQELIDTPFEMLDQLALETYKKKYALDGLAIFIKDVNEISIYQSTVEEEIGVTTHDWGYWDEAFHSLFKGEAPTIDRGTSKDSFWIGPRSRNHYLDGFFRFAYYYNENQNYLINGFVEDNNSYDITIKNLLEDLFVYFNNDIDYISSISLIDLNAYQKAYYNDFKNAEDPVFIYGTFKRDFLTKTNITPEEFYSLNQSQRVRIEYEGKDYSIFLIPAGVDHHKYIIAAVLDDQDKSSFRTQVGYDFMALGSITLLAVLLGLIYILKKYSYFLTFQTERKEAIEAFSKSIASLPEFVYKCKLSNDGELLLTYNDGKIIGEDKYVALESYYSLMKDVYPFEYVVEFKKHVQDVFTGHSKRFEMDYNDEHYEHFVSPITDEQNRVIEIIGFATNITDRRMVENQSKYLATHDSLTGLMNRVSFEESVELQIKNDPTATYAIMFLDLNKFKLLNDTFGHLIGDLALQEVAVRLKQSISLYTDSFVARMGGDEFAVFLPYTEKQEVVSLAEKLIANISSPYLLKKHTATLGVSIGISLYSEDSTIYKQLIHFADMAMYEAKKAPDFNYSFSQKQ